MAESVTVSFPSNDWVILLLVSHGYFAREADIANTRGNADAKCTKSRSTKRERSTAKTHV